MSTAAHTGRHTAAVETTTSADTLPIVGGGESSTAVMALVPCQP
jgi:hypothetical protein